MFNLFLDCASKVLVAPPTLTIKLWIKNRIFTFSTSSLKPPADGASYYARRFPRPRPSYLLWEAYLRHFIIGEIIAKDNLNIAN